MKIVRLVVGDGPLTRDWATGCWYGRTVGRRRVSDAVRVGNRAELNTLLDANAGLKVRVHSAVGLANRVPRRARRSIVVDTETSDMVCYKVPQQQAQDAMGDLFMKERRRGAGFSAL